MFARFWMRSLGLGTAAMLAVALTLGVAGPASAGPRWNGPPGGFRRPPVDARPYRPYRSMTQSYRVPRFPPRLPPPQFRRPPRRGRR